MTTETKKAYEGWTILELMGHRKLAGYMTTEEIGGASFLRIDLPGKENGGAPVATQFYSPSAVYCITPTTEEVARTVADSNNPAPVTQWDVRALLNPARPATTTPTPNYDDEVDDDEEEDRSNPFIF